MIKLVDIKTGKMELVSLKRETSWLITQTKITNKGINSKQWFTLKEVKQRFHIVKT